MNKVTGIKSVDFRVKALGHGVVNWNGPTQLRGEHPLKPYENHTMPKLRGYKNRIENEYDEGITQKGTSFKVQRLKDATDIDFKKTPLYIGQNCIRHHLFREQTFDSHFANKSKVQDLTKLLVSMTGLVRGYSITDSQCKRTTALLIEDFVDQLGNGNYEQFSTDKHTDENGKRVDSSLFSKTTFGDTEYISYGSISIEQLQFISLDKKFDRAAMVIKTDQGEQIAKEIASFLKAIDGTKSPQATFHSNYVRKGTIFEEGEEGILLNQDAIQILVEATIAKLAELSIRQAKGYMYVDEIELDYNDSNKMMRIKKHPEDISPEPNGDYAIYFESK